jgi:ankyrin repeat protein
MAGYFEYFEDQAFYKNNSLGINYEDSSKISATEAGIIFLNQNHNINEAGTDGNTPLIRLSEVGSLELVQNFVEAGADVNILNDINDYALLAAAERSHQDIFNYLFYLTTCKLRKYAKDVIDCKNNRLSTKKNTLEYNILLEAFTNSAIKGYTDKLQKAINRGIDVNDRNRNGMSALHNAVLGHQISSVKTLLNAGAYSKIKNYQGITPIDIARENKEHYPEIFNTLVNWNISFEDLQEELFDKYRGLNFNGENLWRQVAVEASIEFLEYNSNPNFDEIGRGGYTLLNTIANVGDIDLLKRFVELGANVNMVDDMYSYPLLESAYQGHEEIFNYLLPLTNQHLIKKALDILPSGIKYRTKKIQNI